MESPLDNVPDNVIVFERSARRDLRWWMIGIVGALFLSAALTVRPEDNCSEDGACAPWLVPLAGVMGALALAGATGQLLANTTGGSRLDLAAGTLEWWQGRTRNHPGDHGAIALTDIARIAIRQRDEDSEAVSLYGHDGERQAFFDSDVIPWPPEDWARRLVKQVPSIVLDLSD